MERILEGTEHVRVYDTDVIPLSEILKNKIRSAYIWNDYYMVVPESDDEYANLVYVINKNTKKVERTMCILFIHILDDATEISPEELKRALT